MASTAATAYVVALPYPGRGHINPMLAACRLLVAADSALAVTFVVTEEWQALLAASATLPDRIRFATIPNVIPSERGRGADHAGFIEAVCHRMGEPVERLLDRLSLERRPETIVADTYLTWAVAAGARRGIPVCSLWTQPATFFLALYHLDLWPLVDGSDLDEEGLNFKSMDENVPGLSSLRLSDVKIFRAREQPLKIAAQALTDVRRAQCVLLTSFHELEPVAIDRAAELLPCPVYPVGPSVPRLPLEGDNEVHGDEHRGWLDAQPENSVLYVSFGSYVSMEPSQFEEIAVGLRDSGVRFFWVARDKAGELRETCGGDRGLVVPWCQQQKVLCHPSVGGFLSHCGWNSVLEAVCAGVPLLAFPLVWDQLVNARMAADEWKVGIDLREHRGEDGTVSRAAIAAAVRTLMDLDSGAGKEMRRRAAELRRASRSAVKEGGSSHRSLSGFLQDLAEGKLDVTETPP